MNENEDIYIPLLSKEEVRFLRELKIGNIEPDKETLHEAFNLSEEEFNKLQSIANKIFHRSFTLDELFSFLKLVYEKIDINPIVQFFICFHAGVLYGTKKREKSKEI